MEVLWRYLKVDTLTLIKCIQCGKRIPCKGFSFSKEKVIFDDLEYDCNFNEFTIYRNITYIIDYLILAIFL